MGVLIWFACVLKILSLPRSCCVRAVFNKMLLFWQWYLIVAFEFQSQVEEYRQLKDTLKKMPSFQRPENVNQPHVLPATPAPSFPGVPNVHDTDVPIDQKEVMLGPSHFSFPSCPQLSLCKEKEDLVSSKSRQLKTKMAHDLEVTSGAHLQAPRISGPKYGMTQSVSWRVLRYTPETISRSYTILFHSSLASAGLGNPPDIGPWTISGSCISPHCELRKCMTESLRYAAFSYLCLGIVCLRCNSNRCYSQKDGITISKEGGVLIFVTTHMIHVYLCYSLKQKTGSNYRWIQTSG